MGVSLYFYERNDILSIYNLHATWTPIKERRGILRNTATCSIEYAITEGAEPISGAILVAGEKIQFELSESIRPLDGFWAHHHHPHHRVLFIRAVAAGPSDQATVDNLERSNAVNYDISGISTWCADKDYQKDQIVLYNNHLYLAKSAHTSAAPFDITKWTCICGDVASVTVSNDKITVTSADGTATTSTINNVANAGAATKDSAGNNISTVLAQIQADITAIKTNLGI